MKNQDPDHQLDLLKRLPASISITTVTNWVTTGRRRPRFHALTWLSRVGWRLPN